MLLYRDQWSWLPEPSYLTATRQLPEGVKLATRTQLPDSYLAATRTFHVYNSKTVECNFSVFAPKDTYGKGLPSWIFSEFSEHVEDVINQNNWKNDVFYRNANGTFLECPVEKAPVENKN